MAKYVFTQKNVGQASFLVIDRVLALYLAMQSSNERLPGNAAMHTAVYNLSAFYQRLRIYG